MPFTDRELVKQHLVDFRVGQAEVKGFAVILSGTGPIQLPHSGLIESSVVIRACESSAPLREARTLSDDWAALSHTDLVPGSVVVANNTSLGTVYVENIDFTVDHDGGRLRRIASGNITNGQIVTVWYFHYRRYTPGNDYTVNTAVGQVRRLAGGAIEDGQTVLIDYTADFGSVTEETIDQAIVEADQAILQIIDPEFGESTAPGLVVAETYWAVSILCRVRAAAQLSASPQAGSTAAASARAWSELADHYRQAAQQHLQPFGCARPELHYPTTARRSG